MEWEEWACRAVESPETGHQAEVKGGRVGVGFNPVTVVACGGGRRIILTGLIFMMFRKFKSHLIIVVMSYKMLPLCAEATS